MATLSHEMDWLFIPDIRAEFMDDRASKNQMVANIQKAYPDGQITYWSNSREPYLCDIVYVRQQDQRYYVFVNPYTGAVQGEATLTFQRFFRDLHYYLFIPFQIGHFTVLVFGFMLFFSMMTALLFYKNWWRKGFEIKTGKGKVVFFRSLHRLIGVWSIPFVILFSVTGIWYFVERTNIGDVKETANMSPPVLSKAAVDSTSFNQLSYHIDYNTAVHVAQKEIAGFRVKDILPPNGPNSPLYLNGKSDVSLVRNRANRVYMHPLNHEVLKVQNARSVPVVTWLNDIADPLHFGYWGGLWSKILWFIGGLAISGLVLTGIWFSQKRILKMRKVKKSQKLGLWKYINWGLVGLITYLMYHIMITRYNASANALISVSVSWIVLLIGTWYVFVYRMQKNL